MAIFRLSVPQIPDGTNQTLIPRKNIAGKITSQRQLCQVDVYGSAQRRDSFPFYLIMKTTVSQTVVSYTRLLFIPDENRPMDENL